MSAKPGDDPRTAVTGTALRPPDDPVASPCVSVCRMNARSGYCEGCWRTIDEIANWTRYSDGEKRAVWAQLAGRRGA